jgi:hypothetical protein
MVIQIRELTGVVQAALVQALETWSRRGMPKDPAGCERVAATGTRRDSPNEAVAVE